MVEKGLDNINWSPVHDLALVYLALMHGADAQIDPAETATMNEKLKTWAKNFTPEKLDDIIRHVMLVYVGENGRRMLDASVVSLRQSLAKGQRIAILNDLADIASADGMLASGEVNFIQQLALLWDVEGEEN